MASFFGFEVPIGFGEASASGFGVLLTYVVIFLLILIVSVTATFIYISNLRFNRKIMIFENDGVGHFRLTGKDKARLIKIGDGGEEILFLKKRKVYRTAYGRKMGKNEYWFVIGQDGYWYNSLLGDFDAKMGMLDIEPVDRDMRLFHVAVRKNVIDRYRKQNFMDKYGNYIFVGGLMLIFFVGMWIVVDQIGGLINEATKVVALSRESIDPMREALARVDTICSGGSGIVPV